MEGTWSSTYKDSTELAIVERVVPDLPGVPTNYPHGFYGGAVNTYKSTSDRFHSGLFGLSGTPLVLPLNALLHVSGRVFDYSGMKLAAMRFFNELGTVTVTGPWIESDVLVPPNCERNVFFTPAPVIQPTDVITLTGTTSSIAVLITFRK